MKETRDRGARIAIDLCCGLGGWTAGLLAEGWRVIGFDLVKPRTFPSGALFVQQDVQTISGVPFRGHVGLVVASPPCTEFTQIWNIARQRVPDPERGMQVVRHCFRIAKECGAPFVLENVYGACKWFAPEFGPPTWHIGPWYFWGDALVLRPQGSFYKGIGGLGRDKTGLRYQTRDKHRASVRDSAKRSRIPIEIARAVGAQLG